MGSQGENSQDGKAIVANLGFEPTIKLPGEHWTVEKALEKLPGDAPKQDSESPIPFFHMLARLKTSKREGWRRFGINSAESIADHMYRMSLISMFAPPELASRLDMAKCMKMCLIHDMAELLVGDITPVDGVPKPEKSRRESTTMDYLTSNLLRNVAGGVTGEEIRAIWQEYEDAQTLESHYVHDVDKIELLLQMVDYERRGKGAVDLGEFAHVARKVTLPETKAWAQDLLREREEIWKETEHVHGEHGVDGGVDSERLQKLDDYYARD